MSRTFGHDNRQYKGDLWGSRPMSGWGNTKVGRKLCARVERCQDKAWCRDGIRDFDNFDGSLYHDEPEFYEWNEYSWGGSMYDLHWIDVNDLMKGWESDFGW